MDSNQPSTQRRRSERVSRALPVIVRGIDLLGQPFEERTSTLSLNLHGCRYSSKHHLPKNTWVTLEVPRSSGGRNVRARVAWIQRPHSVREFFQIAVELESPANIWEADSGTAEGAAPAIPLEPPYTSFENVPTQSEGKSAASWADAVHEVSFIPGEHTEKTMTDSANSMPEAVFESPLAFSSAADSPLLRELSADSGGRRRRPSRRRLPRPRKKSARAPAKSSRSGWRRSVSSNRGRSNSKGRRLTRVLSSPRTSPRSGRNCVLR